MNEWLRGVAPRRVEIEDWIDDHKHCGALKISDADETATAEVRSRRRPTDRSLGVDVVLRGSRKTALDFSYKQTKIPSPGGMTPA